MTHPNPGHTGSVLQVPIRGMTCASCARRVESELSQVAGVQAANINFATETAILSLRDEGLQGKQLIVAVENAGMAVPLTSHQLVLEGMTCASCVTRIENALSAVPGVVSATVNFALETAAVETVSGLSAQELTRAVEEAGYNARPADAEAGHLEANPETLDSRREVRTLIGSAALTIPLVLPMLLAPLGYHWELSGTLQLVLATPVQVFGGARFYRGAWKALRARSANMDVLVALGTSAAFGLSIVHVVPGGHLYFESSAAIITFILLGKWLEHRAKQHTSGAIRALMDLRPLVARRKESGGERQVPAESISRGDVVLVRPGEQVPVDGMILVGSSHIDESLINGESLPVAKRPDDLVIGGSVNGEGLLEVEATDVGVDSMLHRIQRMVAEAQGSKPPIQRTVDKVTAVFVPTVVVLASVTFLGWLLAGAATEQALVAAVSVLVIACPCALGLATPAALMMGTGAAARAGVLIKNAEALERARDLTVVVFDKTGTLTQGRPKVVNLVGKLDLLRFAAAAQYGSEHPLAAAVRGHADEKKVTIPQASNFVAHPGRGVEAQVEGHSITVGSPGWARERGFDLTRYAPQADGWESDGRTVVWVTADDEILGAIAIGDSLRESAIDAVQSIRSLGIKPVMITGDNMRAAQAVGRQLGIDRVFAEVLPADKAQAVDKLKREGEVVAMVGDGVNDAPALAAADVSFAMGTGTDVAMLTAGVTLMRSEPHLIADAVSVSRATTRKIHQNLFWAFGYNVVGIPLAAFGLLTPMLAGAAMALSSVSVLANALLLGRWRATT